MSLPASTVTVTLKDSNGQTTQRSFEGRVAAITDGEAVAIADKVQTLTQLEVVDVQVSRRVSGFTPTAAEANSSRKETASVKAPLAGGGYHSFNLPALKSTYKSGSNVVANHADVLSFLNEFDDGGGTAATAGKFYCNDGEEILETALEGTPQVEGVVNK